MEIFRSFAPNSCEEDFFYFYENKFPILREARTAIDRSLRLIKTIPRGGWVASSLKTVRKR